MGIREEIEGLKSNLEVLAPMFQTSHGEDARSILETYNEAIDEALSILDKWECVAEKVIGGVDKYHGVVWFGNEYGGAKVEREICDEVNPGDHIIILRRRDE